MAKVSLIVATAKNGVIGHNNTLPWHLPEDLKRFRALTMGHHIIMGRKTYESLGRLLPGRSTVIISRNSNYQVEGAQVFSTLDEAIKATSQDPEVFIIGGAELYKVGLNKATHVYLTLIDQEFEGDAFFDLDRLKDWVIEQEESHQSESGLQFRYISYTRN
jgi:dihydrofolate reductase